MNISVKVLLIILSLTLFIDIVTLVEDGDRKTYVSKEFNLFEDEDENNQLPEVVDDDDDNGNDDFSFLFDFLESRLQRSSFNDIWESAELADESMDSDDEDNLIKLIKKGYRLSIKLSKRLTTLDEISKEFNKFVSDGFAISNSFFNLLARLDAEVGVNYEFRQAIIDMMAQAEKNIVTIHQVISLYKEKILDDESGLGKLETLPSQFNAIAAMYNESMDDIPRVHPIDSILKSLKADVAETIREEKEILRLFRIFMDEQKNLIELGKKLWITSQVDYDSNYEEEDEVEDLTGGLKRSPTHEDILKQILQVRRTRQAISAYSKFLVREGNQNKTSTKTQKDEL